MRVMQMLLLLFWVIIAFNGIIVSAGLPFWRSGTSRVVDAASILRSSITPTTTRDRGKRSTEELNGMVANREVSSSAMVDALSIGSSFMSRFIDYLLSSFLTSSNKKAWRRNFSLLPLSKRSLSTSSAVEQSDAASSKYQLLLRFIRQSVRRLSNGLFSLINAHKSNVWVFCRIAVLSFAGLSIARRIHHWISGMTEYELLLDPKDYLYQTQGNIFHGIGVSLISSLNQSAMEELKYSELCDKLRFSLEQQCFPQTMRTYSLKTGRGVAVLLTEMDTRIRTYRRKLLRYNAAASSSSSSSVGNNRYLGAVNTTTTTAESSQSSVTGLNGTTIASTNDGNSTVAFGEDDDTKGTSISYHALRGLQQETKILLTMQRVLSILQARQTDAYLRLTRMHVLNAANLCEDLLHTWQQKSIAQFQSRRILSVRRFLAQFVGIGSGVRTHTIGGLRRALAMISLPGLRASSKGGSGGNSHLKSNSSSGDSKRSTGGSSSSGLVRDLSTRKDFSSAAASSPSLREDLAEWDSEYLEVILKKLDSREKQMILQVMQRNFYELAGRIQNHLDSLDAIDVQLATAVDSPYALQQGSGSMSASLSAAEHEQQHWQTIRDEHTASHLERSLAYESGWNRLDKWVSDSTALSAQAVAVLSLKPPESLNAPTAAAVPSPVAPPVSTSNNSSTTQVRYDSSKVMMPTYAPTMEPVSPSMASSELLMVRSRPGDRNNETVAISRSTDEIGDGEQQFDGRLLLQLAVLAISVDAVDDYLHSLQRTDHTAPVSSSSSSDGFIASSTDRNEDFFLLGDFQLDCNVYTTIAQCLVGGNAFLPSIEAMGGRVTYLQPWSPIHANNLTFLRELTAAVAAPAMSSNINIAHFLNNVWFREIRYENTRRGSWFDSRKYHYSMIQVLNTLGADVQYASSSMAMANQTAAAGDSISSSSDDASRQQVILLSYMNIDQLTPYRVDRSNCTMRWVFSSGPYQQPSAREGVDGANETMKASQSIDSEGSPLNVTYVRVMLHINTSNSIYSSIVRSYAVHECKSLVRHWEIAARALIGGSQNAAASPLLVPAAIDDPSGVSVPHPTTTTAATTSQAVEEATGSRISQEASSLLQQTTPHLPTGAERVLLQSLRHNLCDLSSGSSLQPGFDDADLLVSSSSSIRYFDDDDEAHFHALEGGLDDADADFYHRGVDDASSLSSPLSPSTGQRHRRSMRSSSSSEEGILFLDAQHQCILQIQSTFLRHREQWRHSGVLLQDLYRAPGLFNDHLVSTGLQKKSRRGLFTLLRTRVLLRLGFWAAVTAGALELTKRSNKLSWKADVVAGHIKSFTERRVIKPLMSILNDVVLNKRTTITDEEALKDAKRSLKAMLNDFLTQHCKSMGDSERKRIVATMDMRPISEVYENELRRPMQSIVSGKIARLVLIQLQFVKKELLVAMQAIDELFNANQVNLQLLAITPAVLSILSLQILSKTFIVALRATSRGRVAESASAIHRDLRDCVRDVERSLSLSNGFNEEVTAAGGAVVLSSSSIQLGKLLSALHRLQSILVVNSTIFDYHVLKQLQEDLRDLALPSLTSRQRLLVVERINKGYPFMQPVRKTWGIQ